MSYKMKGWSGYQNSPLKQGDDKEKEEKWESYYPLTEEQKKDTRSKFDKIHDKHREIGLKKASTDKLPKDFKSPLKQDKWESHYPDKNDKDKNDKNKKSSNCYVDENGNEICRADIPEGTSEKGARKHVKRFPSTSQEELDKQAKDQEKKEKEDK